MSNTNWGARVRSGGDFREAAVFHFPFPNQVGKGQALDELGHGANSDLDGGRNAGEMNAYVKVRSMVSTPSLLSEQWAPVKPARPRGPGTSVPGKAQRRSGKQDHSGRRIVRRGLVDFAQVAGFLGARSKGEGRWGKRKRNV
ncbi:hypothetical protein GGX14DRAFT_391968 [Mycena pura]|uniref:Uncharacterized protein n=1 Tax=Mycena pura TaxID=153505 RepID=A0AAD6VLA6_9AGAR|nr:hypothetical protein GGX14DRAFT_391968 [Mycena pura]